MDWSETVSTLGRFGLTEREADLYLALLRRGPATARELTKEPNLDRVLGYRLLEAMKERGVLQVTAERPRRFLPISPRLLVERVVRLRREALSQDEARGKELADRLPVLLQEAEAIPSFQLLSGAPKLYPTLGEMVDRAQAEVCTLITRRALRDSLRFGLHHRIRALLERGGRFRLVVEEDPLLRRLLERFGRATRGFPRVEIRELSGQPTRMTVVDGREVLLYLVPETRDGTEEMAIWTNLPAFARGHQSYFHGVWRRARPLGGSRRTPLDE